MVSIGGPNFDIRSRIVSNDDKQMLQDFPKTQIKKLDVELDFGSLQTQNDSPETETKDKPILNSILINLNKVSLIYNNVFYYFIILDN